MIRTFDLGRSVTISWRSGGQPFTFTIDNAELLINSNLVELLPDGRIVFNIDACQNGFCWTPPIAIRDKYHTNFFLSLGAANVYLKPTHLEVDGDVCYVIYPFINNCGAVAGFQIPYSARASFNTVGDASFRNISTFLRQVQSNADLMVGAMMHYRSA